MKSKLLSPLAALVGCALWSAALSAAEWKPVPGPLQTRWAADVSPDKVHPEYPRPQFVREAWQNLNGLWDYAIVPRGEGRPQEFAGQILVPFPIESSLSGVKKLVGEQNRLWYRRTFEVPADWKDQKLLLHFGAVDWETEVFVNGRSVGTHRGGYDPFSFDITSALKPKGPQEIVVAVFDPSDAGTQPRGKQVRKPESIWYTPTTGIWQTVWLEPVPQAHLEGLKITPDVDGARVVVQANVAGAGNDAVVELTATHGGKTVATAKGKAGEAIALAIPDAKLWTPDSPHLYDLKATLRQGDKAVDTAASYFGMRKSSLVRDAKGVLRLGLNGAPVFQFGPLDQGFWPDGLYTPPTDEALKYDIEMTKKLGYNMARKHVKVEPARWYYWCDKLGLLVWQDMPSGDRYIKPEEADITRTAESSKQYDVELKALIDTHYNHPSIVLWVPFNEGWGQFDTARVTDWIKDYDPSRLVISASGWSDRGTGDAHDIHVYPGPGAPPNSETRAAVLGEYGGLGLPVPKHTWQDEKNWGYRSYKSQPELQAAYLELIGKLVPLVEQGLAAAVYTQTTDVEIEVNGLMTYDRELLKFEEPKLRDAHAPLYEAGDGK
ncbi:MAG: glycoside hydrolase family 2 TIM barrel-domain containing protein [Pirellulales bacterium]